MDYRKRRTYTNEDVMKYEMLSGVALFDLLEDEYPYIIEFLYKSLGTKTERKVLYIIRLMMRYVVNDDTSPNPRTRMCNFFNICLPTSPTSPHLLYAHVYDWITKNEELLQLRML